MLHSFIKNVKECKERCVTPHSFIKNGKEGKNVAFFWKERMPNHESLICSFPLSNLSKPLTVAHLSWVTWAICSRSLISSERPERFTHGPSFVLSDLSELLTVAHFIWVKWANEGMSNEWMSELPALKRGEVVHSNIRNKGWGLSNRD